MTTRLFPVRLLGAGTPEVESLSSYASRLAATHETTIGRVLRLAFGFRGRRREFPATLPSYVLDPGPISYLVRPSAAVAAIVDRLSDATGQTNLRSGTFLCLKEALNRSMGAFSPRVRWCPDCMAEFDGAGTEAYYKLVWQLAHVKVCPIHRVPLEHRCPACGRGQHGYGARQACSRCARCGEALERGGGIRLPSPSWIGEASELARLVERCSAEPDLVFPSGGVQRVVSELFDRAWTADGDLHLWKLVPRDECLMIIDGSRPVTLHTAQRLAFRLGINLTDLLEGVLRETTGVLNPAWTAELPRSMKTTQRGRRHDRARLLKCIDEALTAPQIRPAALADVARAAGVSKQCLQYHFPAQCAELVHRHNAWRRREARRKDLEAQAAVLSALGRNALRLRRSSRKAILRRLRAETKLPKNILLRAIKEVWP